MMKQRIEFTEEKGRILHNEKEYLDYLNLLKGVMLGILSIVQRINK